MKKPRNIQTGAADNRRFEYSSRYACPLVTVADYLCATAVQACAGNTPAQGLGPQLRVYRREVAAKGAAPKAWTDIGTTCSPEIAPGKPVLGLRPILAAFHKTLWAKPSVHIQPEGNVTLVTLPTYFEVKWPAAGFKPGEIDTVALLGSPVRIRPTAHAYNYVFGDGTTSGQTTSSGGTYPDGDITHAYAKKGRYNTRIDITYGGEYSIGGGPWIPITDTVTIPGQRQTLTVKTAHARLVSK
jgi:hypothetical protein